MQITHQEEWFSWLIKLVSDANTNKPLLEVIDRRSETKGLGTVIDSTDDVKEQPDGGPIG